MAERVTLAGLLSSTALAGGKRVTANYILSTIPLSGPKRLSSSIMANAVAFAGAKIVTAHYLTAAISIHNMFAPILIEREKTIYGVEKFLVELASFPMPEHNPYRPRIPEQLIGMGDDFYDFYEENQQIHREQHNFIQAGDSTFPYQLVIKSHDAKHYKLGSVGKFYHEDYGIFHARYVLFDKLTEVTTPHCPMGLFKKSPDNNLDWRVTNDLTLSDPDLAVGISAPFTLPTDGQYGWVIVDGSILQQVENTSTTAAIGESFAWDSSGAISNTAKGKVLGRRVSKPGSPTDTAIMAGQMWVRSESLSEASIADLVDSQVQDLRDALEELQNTIGSLPTGDQVVALQAQITTLQNKLTIEIGERKAMDSAIQDQIAGLDAVDSAALDNAITNVMNTITAAVSNLTAMIDAVRLIAIEALDKANAALGIDLTSLQTQINELLALYLALNIRPKGKFPVVDGSIPPNLVYLDDGSLVYTETF